MVTKAFEHLFGRLVAAFKRHQDVRRAPDNIAEIGVARWELALARTAMADERGRQEYLAPARPFPPRKMAVSQEDLERLRVEAISAGFS